MADYIRREDALEAIARAFGDVAEAEDNVRAIPTYDVIKEQKNTIKSYERTIRELVNAIIQHGDRKKGKWIDRDDIHYGWNAWECSACGEEFILVEGTPDVNGYNYCPNCGADMREDNDDV